MNPKDKLGVKKAPMSTVPANVLMEVGVAMLEGSLKYGRHNYRTIPVKSSVYYDASMRHMMTWWEGEDTDVESGLSHLTKAIASLVVLRDAMFMQVLQDDRPPKSVPWLSTLNEATEKLLKKHSEPVAPFTEVDNSWVDKE
jgi:hypothetical protein